MHGADEPLPVSNSRGTGKQRSNQKPTSNGGVKSSPGPSTRTLIDKSSPAPSTRSLVDNGHRNSLPHAVPVAPFPNGNGRSSVASVEGKATTVTPISSPAMFSEEGGISLRPSISVAKYKTQRSTTAATTTGTTGTKNDSRMDEDAPVTVGIGIGLPMAKQVTEIVFAASMRC